MAHNKNQNALLYLTFNYISARSTLQILSLKDEYHFHFSNFLIIGLDNSAADFAVR